MAVHNSAHTTTQPTIDVTNPVTGEHIATLPNTPRDDVKAAVDRAREAQPAWAALTVRERVRRLRRWADMLWNERDEAVRVIRRETGKPETGALVEVVTLDNVVAWLTHNAPRILRPQRRGTLVPLVQRATVHYDPHGVVGFITPWNYPLMLALMDALPALAAGNAVVIKPSEMTPMSALFGVELLRRAGVPEGVAQVVTGAGDTGAALVDYVDAISFTGSTATGRKVAARAAERLIPCSLELGGKDPQIILEDADLDHAATGVLRAALENAGQACISAERVYVLDAVYDAFVEKLMHHAQGLVVSVNDGLGVHIGSMTNERELLRSEAHITDATTKGARTLLRGKRRPDLGALFLEPTVLVDVNHTMRVMQEETFGPVVPVMRVRDVDEAVRLANDSDYGLSATVYSRDLRAAAAIARRLETGDVSINRPQVVIATPTVPSGGRKSSGVGRRGGKEGLLRFVTTQTVLTDSLFGLSPSLNTFDPLTLRLVGLLRALRRLTF